MIYGFLIYPEVKPFLDFGTRLSAGHAVAKIPLTSIFFLFKCRKVTSVPTNTAIHSIQPTDALLKDGPHAAAAYSR